MSNPYSNISHIGILLLLFLSYFVSFVTLLTYIFLATFCEIIMLILLNFSPPVFAFLFLFSFLLSYDMPSAFSSSQPFYSSFSFPSPPPQFFPFCFLSSLHPPSSYILSLLFFLHHLHFSSFIVLKHLTVVLILRRFPTLQSLYLKKKYLINISNYYNFFFITSELYSTINLKCMFRL